MRILLFSHVPKNPDGGSSRVYHLLEEGLTARGHEVKALHLEDAGIPRSIGKWIHRFRLPQALSKRASKERPMDYDVIMSSSGMLYPLFEELGQREKHPLLVGHLHGSSYFDHQARLNEALRGHMSLSWSYRHVTGWLPVVWDEKGAKYGDLTIVQNSRDLDFFSEKSSRPTISIPLPVHPQIMEASQSAPPPEEKDPYSILWFGSWVERKGCHYLPRAFKMIVDRFPQARLSIWGSGVGPEVLQREFDPLVWPRVTVVPSISRADQIAGYGRHSIVLFPSISEGFGFALLEAMSMGLAAVTTQSGLGVDWLKDEQNALIIPASSSYHLAEGAMRLMEDRELRIRIAENGKALCQSFTTERFITSYEDVFQEHQRKR
ncbi:MAG TPA: glycosyltransferase family 4 protein [Acidobacteriaceae bacterium]